MADDYGKKSGIPFDTAMISVASSIVVIASVSIGSYVYLNDRFLAIEDNCRKSESLTRQLQAQCEAQSEKLKLVDTRIENMASSSTSVNTSQWNWRNPLSVRNAAGSAPPLPIFNNRVNFATTRLSNRAILPSTFTSLDLAEKSPLPGYKIQALRAYASDSAVFLDVEVTTDSTKEIVWNMPRHQMVIDDCGNHYHGSNLLHGSNRPDSGSQSWARLLAANTPTTFTVEFQDIPGSSIQIRLARLQLGSGEEFRNIDLENINIER